MPHQPFESPGPAGRFVMGSTVAVQYLKYPDTTHWRHDPMVVLGEDDHGLWLGGDHETFLKKGDVTGPTTEAERGFFVDHPFVQLVVPDAWWTLIFNGPDRPDGRISHYVDIVTPPVFDDAEVRWVDLDLDVVRRSGGEVYVDDEDEFRSHIDLLDYPPMWVDRARSEAARIFLAMERVDEPFGDVCAGWWHRLVNG
jgi:protein associated with RNAse G/E